MIPIFKNVKSTIFYVMESTWQCKKPYTNETLENIESSAPYSNISPSKFHVMNSNIQLILMVS